MNGVKGDAPALAVGNVLGTNITIATAALGLSALLFPLTIERSVRRQPSSLHLFRFSL